VDFDANAKVRLKSYLQPPIIDHWIDRLFHERERYRANRLRWETRTGD
jgi:hypothetical protein